MTVNKVIHFPSWQVKSWGRLEKNIRDRAAAEGCAEEKVNAVCSRLKIHHAELARLTEFKMAFPLPVGLSEDQLVAIQGLFRQMEIRCRDQMSALLSMSLGAIAMLEWAWEFDRENDDP